MICKLVGDPVNRSMMAGRIRYGIGRRRKPPDFPDRLHVRRVALPNDIWEDWPTSTGSAADASLAPC